MFDIVLRPEVTILQLAEYVPELNNELQKLGDKKEEIVEAAEVLLKYSGYIEREQQIAEKLTRLEYIKIADDFNYDNIASLSTEGRQKLKRIKPKNIGQAARISGVSPSDVSVLLVYMGR